MSHSSRHHAARSLRKRATDAEQALWRRLRGRRLSGFKFRRQEPYGPFFLDFYCHEARLAIEVDGAGHAESSQIALDQARTEALATCGIRVLRFANADVLVRPELVLAAIHRVLIERAPA